LDEQGFVTFLKKKGKTTNTIDRCVENAREFEAYLEKQERSIDSATIDDLQSFADNHIEKKLVPRYMWALGHFFLFLKNKELVRAAGRIRGTRIKAKRQPFKLKDFRGVKPEHVQALEAIKIRDTKKMLEDGKTPKSRAELAEKTGLDRTIIEEFVKLSDLARLPGVKGIRARLYHDAGFDCVEKLRNVTPEELLRITREFVEKTGFNGIAPLPKEASFTIAKAKKLPDLIEW